MKIQKIIMFTALISLISCFEEPVELEQHKQEDVLLTKSAIDKIIVDGLKANDAFNWNSVDDNVIWSALIHSDSILTVGYRPVDITDVNSRIANINVKSKKWSNALGAVLDRTLTTIREKGSSQIASEDILIRAHDKLPFVDLRVTDIEVIKELRLTAEVRYVEPLGYEVDFSSFNADSRKTSDSGCSNEPNNSIPVSDYTVISPNAKQSWNYTYMNIPAAWNYSTGNGITVGLIDTGISKDQAKLNGQFNSGSSSGRFINKYGTYVSSWWWWASPDGPDDKCGHGTAMAGTIAAPRSNTGTSVGVAYNANLVSVRGTGDVLVNGGKEKTGVSDALVLLGDRSDVKVISMSIGDVFTNSKVADGVRYAYGKGKLIFAAAGTSTSFTNWYGVIFPANMDETVAVTGIKEGGGYSRCDICHSGSKVDFTIVMERAGTENHPLTLAMNGDQPSTVGGSSVATATAAGIAALTWATDINLNRDQVLERLKQSAELYPNRNSEYGWGTLDALTAVSF